MVHRISIIASVQADDHARLVGRAFPLHSPTYHPLPVLADLNIKRDPPCRALRQELNQFSPAEASIHDLSGVGIDPVHLKYALCDIQTIRRTIHFGPSVPEVVDGDATLAPFGPGVPLSMPSPPRRAAGVHPI